MWATVGLTLLWAQSLVWDPLLPELPPHELLWLEGHFSLKEVSAPSFRDSIGDFRVLVARLSWESGQEWYPSDWAFLSEPLYERARPVQQLYLYRWQLHRSGQRLRIRSAPPLYRLERLPLLSQRQSEARFATQSVLASGSWYKVATGEAGIYRLTFQTLQALGIDPATIDPRHLRLYGQKGGPLPQSNREPAPDDLVEIPLYFPGEEDGRWDPGDKAYFWAESPHAWYPLPQNPLRPYFHLRNPYTDSCAYFITFDRGRGARISEASPPSGSPNPRSQVLTLFFHERELTSLTKSGRVWLGENLNTLSPTLSVPLPLPPSDSVRLRVQVAASSLLPTQMSINLGSIGLGTISIPPIPGPSDSYQAQWGELTMLLTNTSPSPVLGVSFRGSGQGYLDFIEAIAWHRLRYTGGQIIFYVPPGGLWQVQGEGDLPPFLWDVSDGTAPRTLALQAEGGGFRFTLMGDTLRRLCAFELEAAYEVRPMGRVPNQNLHGLQGLRFIVATTPALGTIASRFCELHPEVPCGVVTTEALYNEFSGGRPDICALRNFLRMLFIRASTPEERPQYVLIVGAASYNFRDRSPLLFPTYQSRESFYPPTTYGSDDFFGFLDEAEGFWGEGGQAVWYDPRDQRTETHLLDLAISRIPVMELKDVEHYLAKLADYLHNATARGDWLQKFILFSDYKDGGEHTRQAEEVGRVVAEGLPYLDQVKLHIDRYPPQPRASGLVFPQAQEALMAALNSGAFIAHYVGHGNEYTLQGFEFFPITSVRQLQNTYRYLFFVTATCDWGKWDDPSIRSGGVEALFLPMRGAIGLLTSTRKVFSSLNFALSLNFYADLIERYQQSELISLGDLMRGTKNRSWGGALAINTRSFAFLGDPLLPLRIPSYRVIITRIGDKAPDDNQPDTLRALRAIWVEGEIRRRDGTLLTDFDGEATIRLWDKAVQRQTLVSQTLFLSQDILLFSGKATVRQGRFALRFYLPVDILPQAGRGRLSVWVQGRDGSSAAGAEHRFVICCVDTFPPSLPPPLVKLYINDTNWVEGGQTHPNPLLIGLIFDSLGINLSALAIGRELRATLNERDIFLSEYYRAQPDHPNQGKVEYRFSNLPSGLYRLQLRAYNLAGQEGRAETRFHVVETGKLKLSRLFNYPNPFTTFTRFYFEHNQPGQPLEARLFIYTLSGRLVQTFSMPIPPGNMLVQDLVWDGLDAYGDRVGRGVYLYRLEVRNLITGESAHAVEKLVILR
ncbi:MAG: type IX secretion system sortase PorU [Bacteroidia bacterium]|nr:type IX secretion system sortase PorU [Bacteroidia bacterium]MDW8014501.1 type IX secretion system sortase PorU [Bacteroidia bacterium]